jgi:hypothetical protein
MHTTLENIRSLKNHIITASKTTELEAHLKTLGEVSPNTPIPLSVIMDICGKKYALNCIQTVEGHHKDLLLFIYKYAKECLPEDKNPPSDPSLLDVIVKYANGEVTLVEVVSVRRIASNIFWECNELVTHFKNDIRLDRAKMYASDISFVLEQVAYNTPARAASVLSDGLGRKFNDPSDKLVQELFQSIDQPEHSSSNTIAVPN